MQSRKKLNRKIKENEVFILAMSSKRACKARSDSGKREVILDKYRALYEGKGEKILYKMK